MASSLVSPFAIVLIKAHTASLSKSKSCILHTRIKSRQGCILNHCRSILKLHGISNVSAMCLRDVKRFRNSQATAIQNASSRSLQFICRQRSATSSIRHIGAAVPALLCVLRYKQTQQAVQGKACKCFYHVLRAPVSWQGLDDGC